MGQQNGYAGPTPDARKLLVGGEDQIGPLLDLFGQCGFRFDQVERQPDGRVVPVTRRSCGRGRLGAGPSAPARLHRDEAKRAGAAGDAD